MANMNGGQRPRPVLVPPGVAGTILDYFDWLSRNPPMGTLGGGQAPAGNVVPPPTLGTMGPGGVYAPPPPSPKMAGDLTQADLANAVILGQNAADKHRIWCPPVPATITGIGPGQANDKTAYTRIPGNAIPNGDVAVNPEMFGVQRNAKDEARAALAQIELYPDWSAAIPPNGYTPAIPRGLPSLGPYRVSDALSPATSDNRVDLYRYASSKDAFASTRSNIPVRASIPDNGLVKCPVPRR